MIKAGLSLEELNQMLAELGDALYRRGYQDGAAATTESILRAAGALSPLNPNTGGSFLTGHPPMPKPDEKVRAPRGVASRLIDDVLGEDWGYLPLSMVQERVRAKDPRVNVKTIYNWLLRGEKEGKYVRRGDAWDLAPQEQSAEAPARATSADLLNHIPERR